LTDDLVTSLAAFVASDLPSRPALRELTAGGGVLLHGSTSFGIRDAFADLDLWVLATADDVARFDAASPTRFIEFKWNGRPGHYSVETVGDFAARLSACDLPLIAELRHAVALGAAPPDVAALLSRARLPMPPAVREALFRYHYVEMRGDHRALDNPLNRGDATATLLALSSTLAHALRAASVLDAQPYHYSKWLAHRARSGATGRRVVELGDELIALLGTDVLRLAVPEAQHPLNLKLKEIRSALTTAAVSNGFDGDYLHHWWLHLTTTREGIRTTHWP
jgi:hypothetical protein